MAEKEEENRLETAAETTIVVVDQQPSTTRIKPHSDHDEPSDANHKWTKAPDIPSVAEKIKDDLEERSQISPKSSVKPSYVVTRKLSKTQASGVQSKTNEVVKTLENIELTQLTSDYDGAEVKQRAETAFHAKMKSEPVMPIAVKRLETTFPAKINSEPVVSEVVKRFETAASIKKELEPDIKKLETAEKRVKPSEPIPEEVKVDITISEGLEKTVEEKSEGDSILDDAKVPMREETRLSDWAENTEESRKPEICWNDPEYLSAMKLQKYKSTFSSTSKSGIHFVISKGTVVASKSLFTISQMEDTESKMISAAKSAEQFSTEPNCISILREKLDTMRNKIRQFFNK